MWWVWLISLTTGSNIPSYTVQLIYSVYNVRVYPLFTHYINTSLDLYMYIIGLTALQRGRRELCTLVVILSVCHHGIHFDVFKLEHRVLCSH